MMKKPMGIASRRVQEKAVNKGGFTPRRISGKLIIEMVHSFFGDKKPEKKVLRREIF